MINRLRIAAAALCAALVAAAPALAAEVPKRGGILTYLIPADAPPSFDGHRESTFATVHGLAPFYSLLIRVNPANPSSTTDLVCDLCTEMPTPTDGGRTYTFKIRDGVKFHDGSLLTAYDVAATWRKIVDPPEGMTSARQSFYIMVDKIETPDPLTVVFRLKFPTNAFLPSLADPYTWIYKKETLDKDPHWYEQNILGSGPFKLVSYEAGQAIKGERKPDYYHAGLPYLDGIIGILAPKQATRLDAIRSDRAAIEFRGLPPSARDELVGALGDKITVQESDWNCALIATPNHKSKPFDDVRVRRALTLAVDRWHGAPALSKIAIMRSVGGIVKEAGVEGLSFELLNRNVDQPFKYLGTWLVDEWSKVGLKVTQKVVPTGPWFEAMRNGSFEVTLEGNCQSVVNPVLDVSKYQPPSVFTEQYGNFDDPAAIDLYQRMLHEGDPVQQRVRMRAFEKHALDDQVHNIMTLWWYRVVPHRSYVKGWKIGTSHFLNQDLATIWLDR